MRSGKLTEELFEDGAVYPIWSPYDVFDAADALAKMLEEDEVHMRQIKIVIEKHSDGYIGYPLGLKGVVVGQGDTYADALADVKSAIQFHIETFGPSVLEEDTSVLEVFVAEAEIAA
jgi:predicted RNase H-like HicB family nuclease